MRAVFAIDQLNVHPNLVTDPSHAAFEDVVHPKLVTGAELGAAGVGGARRLGMLPRTSPATCAAKPREVDVACTMVETGGSDAITVASIAETPTGRATFSMLCSPLSSKM